MSSTLDTPSLDSKLPSLLQRVTEHGGYAFAAMASRAADGDTRAAEACREMAWEQLQSGPWHSVMPVWRDAYAAACLLVAKLDYASKDFESAMKALDMGMIMGGLDFRGELEVCIGIVREALRGRVQRNEDKSLDEGDKRFVVSNDFNLEEALKSLPTRSLSCKRVDKKSGLSMEGFLQEYFLTGSPVIISDAMNHWPAKERWNDMNYLKNIAGFRTVPVEVGKNYLCSDWKQELITFSEFLDRIQSTDPNSSAEVTYLAQHQLFEQIQELKQDIVTPDYCFVGGGEIRSLNAWFGPSGTLNPLHHDPHHNILAQVVGKKYIRLYPASLSSELYPHSETMLSNSSQVDLDKIDETGFPKFVDLEFWDCILEEGEMLYIPPKWWHYVRSLTSSLSVSFWWSTDDELPQESSS